MTDSPVWLLIRSMDTDAQTKTELRLALSFMEAAQKSAEAGDWPMFMGQLQNASHYATKAWHSLDDQKTARLIAR